MNTADPQALKARILAENRRVHALEGAGYLKRHPEQTNFFQTRLLRETLDALDRLVAVPGAPVLDVGCGTGYLFLPLLARGYHVTGVDLSAEMVRALERSLPANDRERARLVVDDIETFLQCDDRRYRGIVVSALLHHLFDYESILKILCGKLERGGVLLIFFEPLKQAIHFPLRHAAHRWLARWDDAFYRAILRLRGMDPLEGEYETADYQRQFGGLDPAWLAEVLQREHMDVLDVRKYCARRYGFHAWIANRCIGSQNTFNLLARRKG